jgi:type I restriction enzyme S subunit
MKNRWPRQSLSSVAAEIIDGDRGKEYPKHNDFLDSGYCLFLNTSNVRPDGFDFSSCQFISEEKDERLHKGKLVRHDLVMTTRGTIGNVAYYDDSVPYESVRINSGMVIFRTDASRLNPSFLYHFLRSPEFVGQTISLRSGVAQPQFPIRDIKRVELPIPDLTIQMQISSILSAYDNLIENNRRRMRLLEESARQLYQEWFVRLRFPGHEHTRIIDSVPMGWEREPLSDLCESIDYGYTASAHQDEIGPKFLRITDIVPNFIDWNSVPYCPIEEDRLAKFRLIEGDIVIARTGATVGYAKRLHKRHPETVFASYLVRLRLKPEVSNIVVGVFVESEAYKNYVQSRIGGAAQPNANAKILAGVEILVPPLLYQSSFREFVEPLIDEREILQLQNEKLKTARDLLLPRLMNGEIVV